MHYIPVYYKPTTYMYVLDYKYMLLFYIIFLEYDVK